MREILEKVGFFVTVFDQSTFDISVTFLLDSNFDCERGMVKRISEVGYYDVVVEGRVIVLKKHQVND